MGATPEDVRVRLSPEGVEDILKALKQIEKEAKRTGDSSEKAFVGFRKGVSSIKSTLATLGIAATVGGILAFTKSVRQAAEEAGKAGAALGTTAEGISVLRSEAITAGVENEKLNLGLTSLVDSLGELNKGTETQTKAFARLGLTAKDFDGKDTAEAFALVAQQTAKFGDTAARTRAIIDIFGKRVGPQLIPLLQQLGDKGFAQAAKDAERFGLIVDDATAAAADAVGDSFDLMGAQVRGLATQFLSGLAPTVATVMEDFRDDVAGKGVTAAQEFGQKVGKFVRDVIFVFQVAGRAVGKFVADAGDFLGTRFKQNIALLKLNFAEVERLQKEMEERRLQRADAFAEDIAAIEKKRAESEARAAAIGDDAAKRAAQRKALADQLALLEKQQVAAEKQKKEAEELAKLEEAIQREKEAFTAKVEKSDETRLEVEQQIAELQGRTREAKISALDQELDKMRQIFAEAGALNDQQEARLQALRNARVAGIDFDQIRTQGEQAMSDLERSRKRIQQDFELGLITQLEAEQRVIDLEKSRLTVLQQLAEAALKAADATGSPEAIANAQAFANAVRDIEASVTNLTNQSAKLKNAGFDAFQQGLTDLLSNAGEIKSFEDAWRSLASTIVSAIQRVVAEYIAQQATLALIKAFASAGGASTGGSVSTAGGGAVTAAGGGHITGPGTSTSDSIPAWLSDGEFVVRAAAVRQPGVLEMLHQLNRGRGRPGASARKFADGGLVQAGGQTGVGGNLNIGLGLEKGLVLTELQTPEGARAVVRVLNENRRAAQAAIK